MKNSKKDNINHVEEEIVKRKLESSINTKQLSDSNSEEDDNLNSEENNPKQILRKRITEKQKLMDEALEKLEESHKAKSKSSTIIEEKNSTEEEKKPIKKKIKTKKNFFKIVLEKGKEIFVVKKKWEALINALKKLFISIDDKTILINELKQNHIQIKLLLNKLKDEKLLKQLVNSLVFKKILNGKNIGLYNFVRLQNNLISEINKVLKLEKNLLNSTSIADKTVYMDNLYNKDSILRPELQTAQYKNVAADISSKMLPQKIADEIKLSTKFEFSLGNCVGRFEQLIGRTPITAFQANNLYSFTTMTVDILATSIKNVFQGAISQIKDIFVLGNLKTNNFTSFPQVVNYPTSNNHFSAKSHNSKNTMDHHSSITYQQTCSFNKGGLAYEMVHTHSSSHANGTIQISQTQLNCVSCTAAGGNTINYSQKIL